jgi:ankyrin repeat protein
LKRQARELLRGFTAGDPEPTAEVRAHFHAADPSTFALHDAQLVIARAYGFQSWPKLKAFVEGATARQLADAIESGQADAARRLLQLRPELAAMSVDNMSMVHFAVLQPQPEIVRLLMQNGANAREGVYPYREATTAHALAAVRGHDDIVAIIEDEERRRASVGRGPRDEREPSPLHRAAFALDADAVQQLLERGADPNARAMQDLTPIDAVAHRWYQPDTGRAIDVIQRLLGRGAAMTPAAAVLLGDAAWLRARHDAGALVNQGLDTGGLLRIAVTHGRPEILRLLLEWGFDPDERIRFGDSDHPEYSWGMALQNAVGLGQYEMARMLLERGADPNASIYASGDPMMTAYQGGDAGMIALLERHGGTPTVTTAGLVRDRALARRMLAGEASYRLDGVGGDTVAEQLLWGGTDSGDVEIVRMALAHVTWGWGDVRWFTLLEQTLRHDSPEEGWRREYLECFRLIASRCDPNLRGRATDNQRFGLTPLHNIVGRGKLAPAERVAFAEAILDAGARLDARDTLLKSTPLAWACRWGHVPLVRCFLARGADPVERDAEPWATPRAWAERMQRPDVVAALEGR